MKKNRFCALCYRATISSSYFCDAHKATGITKKTNFRVRRALLRSLRIKGVNIESLPKKEYFAALSKHLTDLINKHPTEADILKIRYTGNNEHLFNQIISIAKSFYPLTYKVLKECSGSWHYSVNNMFDIICRKLDPKYPIPFISPDLDSPSDNWKWRWFEILARYEAYNLLIRRPTKRGPESGTGQDKQLRGKVFQLYQKLAADSVWGVQAKIAAELGLSQARISKIVIELGLKRMYDKK